jgi:thiamine-phosphate pyrophosphorylase
MHGLYAVTPDMADTETLVSLVSAAIAGGSRFVQYRNKIASAALQLEQARALKSLCDSAGASLIINDSVEVAVEVEAAGVHLGADDSDVGQARAALGRGKLIGVSCYNRLELARAAESSGADYVAFGSFFPSQVKPGAVRASLELLREAGREVPVPIVAIGGITIHNAPPLVGAGANALAVISALFDAPDVSAAARSFSALYPAGERS